MLCANIEHKYTSNNLKKKTYGNDVTVAPGDLIAAREEGADGIEELAYLYVH